MSYNQTYYYVVFLANTHAQPWACYFCGEDVWLDGLGKNSRKLNVHHQDHDPENNEIKNLVAAHSGCHHTHHGKARLGEVRKKRECSCEKCGGVFLTGSSNAKFCPEHRAHKGRATNGGVASLEMR